MIIIGTKGRPKTLESGTFHCPQCGPDQTFDLVVVKNWLTLYFVIPVLPMGEGGRYIQCQNCGGSFEESTRDYDPVVAEAESKAYFEQLLLRSMMVVAQADGSLSGDELTAIAEMMTTLAETDYRPETIQKAADIAGSEKLKTFLPKANERLADPGKIVVLQALATVAHADGFVDRSEEAIIYEAGKLLGFKKKAVREFLDTFEPGEF